MNRRYFTAPRMLVQKRGLSDRQRWVAALRGPERNTNRLTQSCAPGTFKYRSEAQPTLGPNEHASPKQKPAHDSRAGQVHAAHVHRRLSLRARQVQLHSAAAGRAARAVVQLLVLHQTRRAPNVRSSVRSARRSDTGSFLKPEGLSWTKGGWDDLTAYRWNSGAAAHSFCPVCGIHVGTDVFGLFAINVRCVDNLPVDVRDLKEEYFDGKNEVPLKTAAK